MRIFILFLLFINACNSEITTKRNNQPVMFYGNFWQTNLNCPDSCKTNKDCSYDCPICDPKNHYCVGCLSGNCKNDADCGGNCICNRDAGNLCTFWSHPHKIE